MIPEFITAKPAPNRNAADAPSTRDTNSADQLQNRAAFQKSLHERTADQPTAAAADDVRPERLRQPTPARTTNEAGRAEVSRDTRSAAETRGSLSEPDSSNSAAIEESRADASRTDVNRESEVHAQNNDTEALSGSREPSKQIRRIDPANHSTSTDAATGPSENTVESGEVAKQVSEAVLPSFVSADDANIGTLPSLIRLPLNDVSLSQLSGDFVLSDDTPNSVSSGVFVQPSVSSSRNASGIDSELRPFLDDALIPDAESAATNSRFTATEPLLIAGNFQSSPDANVTSPFAGEELSAIPTLPSLRLVLPSLVPGPKRTTEAAANTEDHNLSGEQTSTRKASTQTSEPGAVPAVSKSSLQVPVPPQVEAASLAQQNVVADNPQVAEPAARSSGDDASGQSKNTPAQDTAVPSPVESNVGQPANDVSRRATLNSESSTSVEKTAASSSGEIVAEQSAAQQPVAEEIVPGSTVPAITERGESSQPAEVESASAARPTEDAGNEPSHSREAIVTAGSNAAPQPARRASTSEDRQSPPNVVASAAAANAVVVETVPSDSADGLRSERASTPAVDVTEPELRKASSDPSPIQKAAHSADNAPHNDVRQSNPERPAVADQGAAEKSAQTSPQHSGEQSAVGTSSSPSNDSAGQQAVPTATTTVERVTVEPRAGNDSEASTVTRTSGTSASQGTRPVSPVAVQPGPVIDVRTGAVVASPSPVSEVGSVSSPSAPVEVQATDVTAVSNVQAAVTSSTAATSNAATRVDVVREPAVPMEIQDAVSAIQEATSGDSHIRVRLNPRELGNMLVDVSRTENGIVARLEVESAAARVAILETLPDLQQSLSRSGSTVDRVEVVLTETRAESGRQESDQSQPREQQSRQERQSSNQQARDDQNQRREQNQRRNQREDGSSVVEDATGNETSEQLDIKL